MRKYIFITFFFTVLISLQAFGAGKIYGLVIDKDTGSPLAAEIGIVIYSPNSLKTKHIKTNDNGEFEIDGLPASKVHLSTKLEGYAAEKKEIELLEGEELNLVLRLVKSRTIHGIVYNEAGKVVPKATVRVLSSRSNGGQLGVTYQWESGDAETNISGEYQLSSVHPDKFFIIEVYHPDYMTTLSDPMWLEEDENTIQIDFIMQPGVSIIGMVKDKNGASVKGANISIINYVDKAELLEFMPPDVFAKKTQYVESAADGGFHFDHLRPGVKKIFVSHPNYKRINVVINLTSTDNVFQKTITLTSR